MPHHGSPKGLPLDTSKLKKVLFFPLHFCGCLLCPLWRPLCVCKPPCMLAFVPSVPPSMCLCPLWCPWCVCKPSFMLPFVPFLVPFVSPQALLHAAIVPFLASFLCLQAPFDAAFLPFPGPLHLSIRPSCCCGPLIPAPSALPYICPDLYAGFHCLPALLLIWACTC